MRRTHEAQVIPVTGNVTSVVESVAGVACGRGAGSVAMVA